jgi:hypothetical protein
MTFNMKSFSSALLSGFLVSRSFDNGVHSFTLPKFNPSVNRQQQQKQQIMKNNIGNLRAINGDNSEEAIAKKRVVVIGNGMVGQRFMENLLSLDAQHQKCTISTFCEEPRAAYNRVKLTSYFETRDPSALSMTSTFDSSGRTAWYTDNNVELLLNDKAVSIDTQSKTIVGASGKTIEYDVAVLATGSYPFVPPIPGRQRPGVFVYRVSNEIKRRNVVG